MTDFDPEEFARQDPRATDLERKVARLERTNAELRATRKELLAELELAEDRVKFAESIKDVGKVKKIRKRSKSKNDKEGCPVLLLSDTHIGELVEPATVNGRNEYNPEIAEQSLEAFFQNCVYLIEKERTGIPIRQAVLWVGGDIITGYLHEENVEQNPLSPTEEILMGQRLIVSGINHLMTHAGLERLHVVCNYGNHGRTTRKPRIATGAKNSYEWLMYHNLAQRFADDDAVDFTIANGEHLYVDILGTMCRFHHGDAVRYHGGVGGLSLPLRKACDAWDDFKPADITFIGHYHQFVDYGFAVVNGSTKGYDPYALHVKARYEPPQQGFVLIDSKRGKTTVSPVFVR